VVRRIPLGFWWKALPAFGAAALVGTVLPRRGGGGVVPPAGTLLLSATLIGLITAVAIYAVIRLDLGLPASVAFYAVCFNLLVVAVKFGLAPHGMYQVNQRVAFQDFGPDNAFQAGCVALLVFALYGGALFLLYRLARGRLLLRSQVERPSLGRPNIAPALAALVILFAITGGSAAIALPLVVVSTAGQYLSFVFSSGVSLVVALALAFATALAALAFREVRQRVEVLGDAAVLVSFFWVALAFLALYHVLWVVYVLALTATWPLRVVVPK